MSIYALARQASRSVPGLSERAPAAGGPKAIAPQSMSDGGVKDSRLTSTTNALAKYIPKEIVTLYVAGLAAGPAIKSLVGFGSRPLFYWAFVILTGPTYLVVYLSFLKANNKLDPGWKKWPWWQIIASVIAFAVWALAVPGNPYVKGALGGAAAGFVALFVSTFLSLADPWLDNTPSS